MFEIYNLVGFPSDRPGEWRRQFEPRRPTMIKSTRPLIQYFTMNRIKWKKIWKKGKKWRKMKKNGEKWRKNEEKMEKKMKILTSPCILFCFRRNKVVVPSRSSWKRTPKKTLRISHRKFSKNKVSSKKWSVTSWFHLIFINFIHWIKLFIILVFHLWFYVSLFVCLLYK